MQPEWAPHLLILSPFPHQAHQPSLVSLCVCPPSSDGDGKFLWLLAAWLPPGPRVPPAAGDPVRWEMVALSPHLGHQESQEQGGLISCQVLFSPQSFPMPSSQPCPARGQPSHPSPAPVPVPPLQTPLSLFCPHCTGLTADLHLAPLGGTAQLLCPLALWPVTVPTMVRWLRSPHPDGSQLVHVFRDGRDQEEGVTPEFKGRTALLRDPQEGSITLEIHHVRLEDRGPYRCQVQVGNVTRDGSVTLQVAG